MEQNYEIIDGKLVLDDLNWEGTLDLHISGERKPRHL